MKVIKEIVIMLLVCLVTMLLFAVIFYNYLPARKIIPEVTTYSASDTVKELLADNIDSTDSNILLTFEGNEYEVTKSDLNNYETVKKYVPGKSNPFAAIKSDVESSDENNDNKTSTDDNTTDENKSNTSNSTKDNKSNTSSKDSDDEEYIKDKGTK